MGMAIKALVRSIIDFCFPALCLLCRKFLSTPAEQHVCAACLDAFPFIRGVLCPRCGIPFVSQEGSDHLCSRCISKTPFYDSARSIGVYAGVLRHAIHQFKYDHRSLLSVPLGAMLSEQGRAVLKTHEYDVIMPVLLHPRRVRQRGFNQSLSLARTVAQAWGIAIEREGLKRTRWTDPQTMLPEKDRVRNVRGAFAYQGQGVTRKTVLLIDDVYTSGSTVNECAKVLKKQGAGRVDVLTLARTL
jgi:ComF family protein